MSEFIKNLSYKAEFLIVISICFGYSILTSIIIFISSFFSTSTNSIPFTNESLFSIVLFEILLLIIVFIFLKVRDNPIDYRNNTNLFKLLGASLLLTIVYYLSYFLLIFIVAEILPENNSALYSQVNVKKEINPFIIIALSIVNPVFEELIAVGYIITVLSKRKGIFFAINISVLIRFLYHLYQGPIAALSIIPMGLIFAFVYLKWKNIWPLIIAHGIMDFIALYMYGI